MNCFTETVIYFIDHLFNIFQSITIKFKRKQFYLFYTFEYFLDTKKHPKLFYRSISVFLVKNLLPVLFTLQ